MNNRFPRCIAIKLTRDMMQVIEAEARHRQQTLSEYARQSIQLRLKQDGVGRPLNKQQTNKEAHP
jgi:hypothetical protein